ncbi:Protein of unknown function [Clostridium cavendishii DSM 21758]|uniref:DUF1450 domain-containing protein n=1 Tax=Clostridium cavendishii DSM 21758 TaxID=1121302 RepID=A0A1M6CNA3_9CLOT|nr:DUF1450 domain-containing protein [Clostridium cavendishii]SHI62470.1 Protein of unknown function [Clostridium cavendishii DSM 21758]
MKEVQMCPNCNEEFIAKFKEMMEEKGVEIEEGCIGQCGTSTPICLVDGEVVEADTVEELAAQI